MNSTLTEKHCQACEGGIPALNKQELIMLMTQIADWQLNESATEISREFRFKNYYQTMAFVNAIAWLAHQENHHPDLEVHYNHVNVRYSTHAVNGLTENDMICAAKINALL